MVMFGGVTNVDSTTRTNQVFKIWLRVPSLKEISWEALIYYRPRLVDKSRSELLSIGIPPDFVKRVAAH